MAGTDITVNSRKFDNSIRRSWKCGLIERDGPLLVFLGEFEFAVEHPDLGHIKRGTISYEYYWRDRWYNIFRFHEPDGELRNWYCNVNMPPSFDNGVLDYVDLDIDILVWPDGELRILDEDEFAANAEKYQYSDAIMKNARNARDELLRLISLNEFPFDQA